MKVRFKYAVGSYAGTIDEGTFWGARSGIVGYMRKYVIPRLTDQNTTMGNIMSNLAVLWAAGSDEYKADLKTYAERYASDHPSNDGFDTCRSKFAFWVKAMWAWKLDVPSVDLSTLTVEDFEMAGTGLVTVRDMITNGYLPTITLYDDLTEAY